MSESSGPSNSDPGSNPARSLKGKNVLLGASGSVASIRVPRLVQCFERLGATVRVAVSKSAEHFVQAEEPLRDEIDITTDRDEWAAWSKLSDPVLHIELRKWADVFVIAPTSANTLAKLANGLCDNLLTSVARAWPLMQAGAKPLVIAPAMNTMMWQHPLTESHLKTVTAIGIHIVNPISKKLACGDTGVGAMEEPEKIAKFVLSLLL